MIDQREVPLDEYEAALLQELLSAQAEFVGASGQRGRRAHRRIPLAGAVLFAAVAAVATAVLALGGGPPPVVKLTSYSLQLPRTFHVSSDPGAVSASFTCSDFVWTFPGGGTGVTLGYSMANAPGQCVVVQQVSTFEAFDESGFNDLWATSPGAKAVVARLVTVDGYHGWAATIPGTMWPATAPCSGQKTGSGHSSACGPPAPASNRRPNSVVLVELRVPAYGWDAGGRWAPETGHTNGLIIEAVGLGEDQLVGIVRSGLKVASTNPCVQGTC